MRRLFVLAAITALTAGAAAAGEPRRFMIEATVGGTHLEGAPLAWSDQRVWLLGRDGRLWDFAPDDARDYRKTASYFNPYSTREIRTLLEAELGRQIEVSLTPHFLVAHPPGQGAYWSERFEQVYRQFAHYFSVRGIAVQQPAVPLVAIVFTRQSDFLEYAFREGNRVGPNVLGYYAPRSNRVALFDIGAGGAAATDWRQNSATIVHETAHQLAFNTGVHNRLAPTPRWLAEGLATLFEARGVWDSDDYRQLGDRINRGRLADFKQQAAGRTADWLPRLIASDRLFQADPPAAYCQSWALTFFLVETQPRAYADYLAKTAARTPLAPYTATQRTADFVAAFGDDWRMLGARLSRLLEEVP